MKRLILALAFLLALAAPAFGFDTILLNNVTAGGNSSLIDFRGYYNCSVQIECTAAPCTGTAIMVLQNTLSDNLTTSPVITVTNPVAGQMGYSGPCNGIGQIQLTWFGGTWLATATRNK